MAGASTILRAAAEQPEAVPLGLFGPAWRSIAPRSSHWSTPTHAEALIHRCALTIAADHPALPGHFPGRPIVPGVVLLDRVLSTAELWLGEALSVTALRHAKFASMLLPAQTAELELQLNGEELRFAITRAGEPLAQGAFAVRRCGAAG